MDKLITTFSFKCKERLNETEMWERLGFLILLMCFALKGVSVSSKSHMCESLIVPSWCRPACGSLVKARRARTGTAGSSGLLGAGNQTPPCRSRTLAPSTWSYLEVVGGMERYFKTWDKEAPECVSTCFEQPPWLQTHSQALSLGALHVESREQTQSFYMDRSEELSHLKASNRLAWLP